VFKEGLGLNKKIKPTPHEVGFFESIVKNEKLKE
jgi:hypothetical protein